MLQDKGKIQNKGKLLNKWKISNRGIIQNNGEIPYRGNYTKESYTSSPSGPKITVQPTHTNLIKAQRSQKKQNTIAICALYLER